jgi:hypothetical protein
LERNWPRRSALHRTSGFEKVPDRHLAASPDFSPGIVGNIQRVLGVVRAQAGAGRDAVIEALRVEYFQDSASGYADEAARLEQQRKRANNVLIGLREYGLAHEDGALTTLALDILDAGSGADVIFARHIILELDGLDVLRAVRDLQDQQKPVRKDTLASELRTAYGFEMPRDTTKHLTMLNWLRPAGVFSTSGYEIADEVVQAVVGVTLRDVDEWQLMPLPRQAFLQALKRISDPDPDQAHPVKVVLDQAELEHGHLFQGGQTARDVLTPLEADGWIEVSKKSGGRGAKSGAVAAAERLRNLDLNKVRGFHTPPLPPDLRKQMNKPLDVIAKDLADGDTFVAGIALELLALRMAVSLGLSPVELRKRDDKTGGGEVDLLAEGVHLHHSRWLFQCKNQRAAVTVSTLAKEVGMAVLLRAQVIVLATTGRFASSVSDYAHQVAETTTMQVVLVDGDMVRAYLRSGDEAIQRFFHTVAGQTLLIKQGQRDVANSDE